MNNLQVKRLNFTTIKKIIFSIDDARTGRSGR